jgi:hypothetical protein
MAAADPCGTSGEMEIIRRALLFLDDFSYLGPVKRPFPLYLPERAPAAPAAVGFRHGFTGL